MSDQSYPQVFETLMKGAETFTDKEIREVWLQERGRQGNPNAIDDNDGVGLDLDDLVVDAEENYSSD